MSKRKLEPFSSIPARLLHALERGDINLDEFGLLAWLSAKANYRKVPPEFIGTIAGIAEAVDWEKSDETLRRHLHKWKADNWIDFELGQGKRKPFIVTLTGLRCGERVEVESDTRKSGEDASVYGVNDSDASDNRSCGSPTDTDTEANVKAKTEAEQTDETASADFVFGGGAGQADPTDYIAALVSELRSGKDQQTERTYRRKFEGKLGEHAFRSTVEKLRARRADSKRPPLVSEARYAYSELNSFLEGGYPEKQRGLSDADIERIAYEGEGEAA